MEMELKTVRGGGGGGGDEDEEVELPGFRFHPTDEELVAFYLRRKVEKKPLRIDLIKQVDICKYDPWDLPKVSSGKQDEWYFFCLRGRKYKNSIRPNRVTGTGFWKATGIDKPIYNTGKSNNCIGLKKSLVYYIGRAGKGTKTDWMMHEFRLPTNGEDTNYGHSETNHQSAEIWTICRIFKRNATYRKFNYQEWRVSTANKNTPTESSSKTCSFESNNRDEYRSVGASTTQYGGENALMKNQCCVDQWGTMVQSPLTAINPNFLSLNGGEFFGEGSWDELGRMMGFTVDPASLS